jgi:hypothetical protein
MARRDDIAAPMRALDFTRPIVKICCTFALCLLTMIVKVEAANAQFPAITESVADFVLIHHNDLKLSVGQVKQLQDLRLSTWKETINRTAALQIDELDLDDLKETEVFDLTRINAKAKILKSR